MDSVKKSAQLQEKYRGSDAASLLAAIIKEEFPGRLALVSSFGAEAALLLDMVAKIDPALPIIFLDTQKLFPETLAYRDLLIKRLGLKDVRTIYPDYADTSRRDPDGMLWGRDVNACCYIRKVRPLQKALKGFDAWITGRKRFQGGLRTDMEQIESADGKVKINPLATWGMEDIAKEFAARNLPEHPLKAQGYLSIGCKPCTSLPENKDDPRSGRWQGQEKTECGIHMGTDGHFYPDR